MAKDTAVTMFVGEDRLLEMHVKNLAEDTSINVSGWTIAFLLKRKLSNADASALITKTAAVAGTFNSDPDTNTQRATVTIEDSDNVSLTPGLCFWEMKRTDAGFETVLGYGRFNLRRGVHVS